MMKKSIIGLAIAAALLSGCDDSPTPDEQQAYVEQEAGSKVRAQLAEDEKELKSALAELQKADPSVLDLYYTISSTGEKQLHIVRKEDSASSPTTAPTVAASGSTPVSQPQAQSQSNVSDMIFPLVGGLAAGALITSMINSGGGVRGYAAQHPPASSSMYQEEERRKQRNVGTAGYSTALMSRSRASVSSSPNFSSNMRQSVSSSRAISSRSGAIFSGSSARAGGYSAGS